MIQFGSSRREQRSTLPVRLSRAKTAKLISCLGRQHHHRVTGGGSRFQLLRRTERWFSTLPITSKRSQSIKITKLTSAGCKGGSNESTGHGRLPYLKSITPSLRSIG